MNPKSPIGLCCCEADGAQVQKSNGVGMTKYARSMERFLNFQARSFHHDGLGRLDEAPVIHHIGQIELQSLIPMPDLRLDGSCFGECRSPFATP
jgi:hypothetical protein